MRLHLARTLALTGLAVLSAPAVGTPAPVLDASSVPSLSAALGGGRALRMDIKPKVAGGEAADPRLNAGVDRGTATLLHQRAFQQARAAAPAPAAATWQTRGPEPIVYAEPYEMGFTGFGESSGRVVSLAVDTRDASGETVYAGTSAGGLWHTTDGGRTWRAMFQDQSSLTVGAVAIDPRNGVLYVGTGEPNFNVDGMPGTGVYRSLDGGRTWQLSAGVPIGAQVWRVLIAGDRVFAATTKGLYVSTDGGKTYSDVLLPTNADATAPYDQPWGSVVSDLVVSPDDPNLITAAVGNDNGRFTDPATGKPMSVGNGLYRSTEGGGPGTWSRMDVPTFGRASTSGDPIGRVSLAYARGEGQDHRVMWALIHDAGIYSAKTFLDLPAATTTSLLNGVYRSGDDGATWQLEADANILSNAPGGVYADALLWATGAGAGAQAWYNQYIAVDPTDESRVLVGLEEIYQPITDPALPGPSAWETVGRYWSGCKGTYLPVGVGSCVPVAQPESGASTPHPDHHAVAFATTPDGVRVYDGGDGGIYIQDAATGEPFVNDDWEPRNDGLSTAKPYYAVMGRDGQILTGMQDNGTALMRRGSTRGVVVHGGDGGAVAIDPSDPDVMYAEYQFGGFGATTDGGETWTYAPPPDGTFAFIPPFSLDDAIVGHLLMGGQVIYESVDGPQTTTADWLPVFDLLPEPDPLPVPVPVPVPATGGGVRRVAVATDLHDGAAYVTWCQSCYVPYTAPSALRSGLATNVKPGCTREAAAGDCWHHAAGKGLPTGRVLSDVAIDRRSPSTVVVSASGYATKWVEPEDSTQGVGRGHVYLSRDGGETFTDISRGLPDAPALTVVLRGDEVYVGTTVGAFVADRPGAAFRAVNAGLPPSPVYDLTLNPQRDTLVASTHGRGVWTLSLSGSATPLPRPKPLPVTSRPRAPLPATGGTSALTLLGAALIGAAAVLGRTRRTSRPFGGSSELAAIVRR